MALDVEKLAQEAEAEIEKEVEKEARARLKSLAMQIRNARTLLRNLEHEMQAVKLELADTA